jgi:hypothetical protein
MASYKGMIMKKVLLILICVFPFLVISCTHSTQVTDDSISVSVENESLKIKNMDDDTVYLFVVEQEYAALIN